MIIPKANFLNTAYQKNKNELRHAIQAEKVKLKSEVIGALRLPQNHKLGKLVFVLTEHSYPFVCKNLDDSIMTELIEELKVAGYNVELITGSNAKIKLVIDWTQPT